MVVVSSKSIADQLKKFKMFPYKEQPITLSFFEFSTLFLFFIAVICSNFLWSIKL